MFGGFSRTFRVLMAIVRGLCIVTRNWLDQCVESGRWLDPRQYRCPRYASLKIGSPLLLFQGKRIYLGPSTNMENERITILIKEAGGSVSKSLTDVAQGRLDLVIFGVRWDAVEWAEKSKSNGNGSVVMSLKKMVAAKQVVTQKVCQL